MIMNYLPGGDLCIHLEREGKFSLERARLYTAELVLGLGYLHELGIIYRDLKTENILLDGHGHVCITDFGLSKSVEAGGTTTSFCGIKECLAPEVLLRRGCAILCDLVQSRAISRDLVHSRPGGPPQSRVRRP